MHSGNKLGGLQERHFINCAINVAQYLHLGYLCIITRTRSLGFLSQFVHFFLLFCDIICNDFHSALDFVSSCLQTFDLQNQQVNLIQGSPFPFFLFLLSPISSTHSSDLFDLSHLVSHVSSCFKSFLAYSLQYFSSSSSFFL